MEEQKTKIEKFYIHFDQPEHYLSINEYEQILKSTKKIFNNLTTDIMNIDADFELVVYAPQKGCLITIFGISITVDGLIKFLETDIGKAFVKGLTNREPAYWTGKLGELIKILIIKIYEMPQKELKEFIEKYKKIDEKIIKLDKSRKASGDFYRMCTNNPNIKAIGFSKDNIFTVGRNSFEYHLTGDINRDLGIENKYKKLTIIRPVTANNPKDKWTLAESGTKDGQSYIMADACFQSKTLDGNFLKQGANDDEVIAEIEYKKELKNGEEIFKDRKILKVYELNGISFKNRKVPKDVEFDIPKKKILEHIEQRQISLFEQKLNKENTNNT